MTNPSYGFEAKLEGISVSEAIQRVTEALKVEGFGVLTSIDIQKAFSEKLGVDFRPYVILGACNPKLAHKALGADPYLGLLLPCNVVVQEMPGGKVSVTIADPAAMFELVKGANVEPIAADARERLGRVLEAVRGS
jgi:uncharacterized protein (DUF302 family)